MLDRIKVIILTIREMPDRLPYLLPLAEHLSTLGLKYEIFYGIYGKNITVTDTDNPKRKLLTLGAEAKVYDTSVRLNGKQMTAGELGCAWSHLKIQEKLLADPDHDGYLVLEDDAAPAVTVSDIIKYLNNIPANYDVCRIGKSTWDPYIKISKINDYYWTYARRFTNHTTAYVISKSGARKVIAHMEGRLDLPADDILTKTHICTDDFIAYTPDSYLFFDPGIHASAIERIAARAITE